MEFLFSKWNPCGNTTLLFAEQTSLTRAALASKGMQHLGGEQAGFYDLSKAHLQMAGGEFCVNASRSFAALLDYNALQGQQGVPPQRHYRFTVSGWETPLEAIVQGKIPHWQVEVRLCLPPCPLIKRAGYTIVQTPGISHVLLNGTVDASKAKQQAMAILEATELTQQEAAGVIWWQQSTQGLAMQPLVYVRDTNTLVAESACGSGALALSIALQQQHGVTSYEIWQPSGDSLRVELLLQQTSARIGGNVDLLCEGTYFL